ncbi:hypothetical protein ACFOKI_03100 [Sphingomonas qilianensis]|uniref:Uncharacterized protein n=1 Tax=Sphingomonas qilianensis TaxID=1736690 RepID=A0ABU9XVE6_9SPHN
MADTPEHDGELPPRHDISRIEAHRPLGATHGVLRGHGPVAARQNAKVLPFPRRPKLISKSALQGLLTDHARLRDLCDELESLADCLPAYPPLEDRRTLADKIERATIAHVKTTSSFLGRFFSGNEPSVTRSILSRILLRQISDAMHAEDTADILRSRSLTPAAIDMLSYMLRFLFEGGRRALDCERLFLLSLGSTRLTRSALANLEGALA